jgi:inhibitor of KinA sporulation pathway (predicted exonuclease)
MDTPKYYLVIDLEATCDADQRLPRHETEIIEIGAVLCDGQTLQPAAEFQTFVRPIRHPRLTAFCTALTTIRQADVDRAPVFPQAIERLRRFVDGRDFLFCSWGDYDRNQFRRDAERHRVRLPLGARHLNLKQAFQQATGAARLLGTGQALASVGLTLEGTHHRGIDDARNIAKLLPFCVGQRAASARRSAEVVPRSRG